MSKITPDHVARARFAHYDALETLRAPGITYTGLQIWRKLRRLEDIAHRGAEAWCNGDILYIGTRRYDFQCDENDRFESEQITRQITRIFGHVPTGFFWNTDARGYALKIQSEHVPQGMHTDWGRYGILAADIN